MLSLSSGAFKEKYFISLCRKSFESISAFILLRDVDSFFFNVGSFFVPAFKRKTLNKLKQQMCYMILLTII